MNQNSNNVSVQIRMVVNKKNNMEFLNKIIEWVQKYININVDFIEIDKIKKMEDFVVPNVDFYFVDYIKKYEKVFAWDFYSLMHNINPNFKMIFILEKYNKNDYQLFKNGADDIVYNNGIFDDVKWKIFSLLRRKWDTSHSIHTLIHKGIVIDLIKQKVISNNKEINITKKEFILLSILVEEYNKNSNNFVLKTNVYKKIYDYNDNDPSRLIDQLIFRLKKKLGKDFILVDKKRGIKIN